MFSRSSWGYFLLIASVVAIGIATTSPFNFVIPDNLSKDLFIDSFHSSTNIKDYIRNILLFVCFGISCAKILINKKSTTRQILIVSFILSTVFSLSIELIQILLPSRVSSLSDILCNSLGGLIGSVLYCWRKDFYRLVYGTITRNYWQINLKFLVAIILSYVTTIICGWFLLTNSINLNNWNKNAYLAIASEVTGQVFWRGYITSLYVCDRAIERSQISQAFEETHSFFSQSSDLVTSFLFLDYQSNYLDRNAQIPNLHWEQKLSPKKLTLTSNRPNKKINILSIDEQIHNHKTVLFHKRNSLISTAPATKLNQHIKATQEFTLSIILATNKLKQVGPSRIISLAENINSHNMMLGQENSDLVFRLRTPTTGEQATQPSFYVPNFFQDTDLHQILITFADRQLTFYIDNPERQYNFVFQPSTLSKLFFPLLVKQWKINLTNFNLLRSKIIFNSLVATPLLILISILILCFIQRSRKSSK